MIEAQVTVVVRWDEPSGVFVGHAPALGIYSQGPSAEDAVRAIEGAMRMYLVTALEANKLDGVVQRFDEVSSGMGPEARSQQYIKVVPGGGLHKVKLIPSEIGQG